MAVPCREGEGGTERVKLLLLVLCAAREGDSGPVAVPVALTVLQAVTLLEAVTLGVVDWQLEREREGERVARALAGGVAEAGWEPVAVEHTVEQEVPECVPRATEPVAA